MIEAKRGFSNSIKVREFVSDKGGSVEHEVCIPGAQPSTSQTSPPEASVQNLTGRLSKTYAFALQSTEHYAVVLRYPSAPQRPRAGKRLCRQEGAWKCDEICQTLSGMEILVGNYFSLFLLL